MQLSFKHIRWMPILMAVTILGIAGFQMYWLKKAYEREKRTMEIRSNMSIREASYSRQAAKLDLDKMIPGIEGEEPRPGRPAFRVKMSSAQKATRILNELNEKVSDSLKTKNIYIKEVYL